MQRKAARSGASNVSVRGSDQSSVPKADAARSAQPSAYPMGSRRSVVANCASVEPSRSSTMECTIDCGCTTMSMRS